MFLERQPRCFLLNWSSTQNSTKDPMTHQHTRLQASFTDQNNTRYTSFAVIQCQVLCLVEDDKQHGNMAWKAKHVECIKKKVSFIDKSVGATWNIDYFLLSICKSISIRLLETKMSSKTRCIDPRTKISEVSNHSYQVKRKHNGFLSVQKECIWPSEVRLALNYIQHFYSEHFCDGSFWFESYTFMHLTPCVSLQCKETLNAISSFN